MAITFPVATKNSRADTEVDKLDVGTTNANGQIWLRDSGDNNLSKHNLSNPAFGASSAGASVANAIADGSGLAAGVAVKYVAVDRDENIIWTGSVGPVGSGADLEGTTSSTTIAIGEVVEISSLTYVEVS